MINLITLVDKTGFPALVVLDQLGAVKYVSTGAHELLADLKLPVGQTLPAELSGWRLSIPWEAELGGRTLVVTAHRGGDETLLVLEGGNRAYSEMKEIMNSIDEGIHVVNENGETVFYNPTMAKMEGMDYSQVINKNVLAMFPSLTPETSTILRVLRTREPIYDQVQTYFNHRGQRITTVNSTIPLWHRSRFIGVLEVAKDVTRMEDLARKVVDLQQQLYTKKQGQADRAQGYTFADIIGDSPSLRQQLELARRAARTASPVLIYGETGTGKELVAQSIHNASTRSQGPFIAQNCAALPGSLLEGILFGTVKGSFTGALDRPGLIEQAQGGTLLLDEINSMGIDLQAKLLRVLQDSRVRRIGGLKEVAVDVRVIATTNVQPQAAISQGTMRLDLYYRLAVVNITLPTLSRRREDIDTLSRYFVDKYNREFGLQIQGLTPAVAEIFRSYLWPGNVRELEHIIEGAMNIIDGESAIDVQHLPPHLLGNQTRDDGSDLTEFTLPEALDVVERRLVIRAMERSHGNITRAARMLGITRQVLQYKLKRHGL